MTKINDSTLSMFPNNEIKPKMVYGTGVFFDGINYWLSHLKEKPIAFGLVHELIEKHTIMQYTGLKDKNGKEIYEGDILQSEGSRGDVYFGKVVFRNDSFIIDDETLYDETVLYKVSVVGNIYENPGLLN